MFDSCTGRPHEEEMTMASYRAWGASWTAIRWRRRRTILIRSDEVGGSEQRSRPPGGGAARGAEARGRDDSGRVAKPNLNRRTTTTLSPRSAIYETDGATPADFHVRRSAGSRCRGSGSPDFRATSMNPAVRLANESKCARRGWRQREPDATSRRDRRCGPDPGMADPRATPPEPEKVWSERFTEQLAARYGVKSSATAAAPRTSGWTIPPR